MIHAKSLENVSFKVFIPRDYVFIHTYPIIYNITIIL